MALISGDARVDDRRTSLGHTFCEESLKSEQGWSGEVLRELNGAREVQRAETRLAMQIAMQEVAMQRRQDG